MKILIELGEIRRDTRGPFLNDIVPDAGSVWRAYIVNFDKGMGPKAVFSGDCSPFEPADGKLIEGAPLEY